MTLALLGRAYIRRKRWEAAVLTASLWGGARGRRVREVSADSLLATMGVCL